jgi:hypothetical protein
LSYTQLSVVQIISLISSLLPIVFFIWFCTKTHIKGFWVIFLYSIVSLISDFFLSSDWGSNHTFLLWNIYTILEYSILSFFFYIIIKLRLIRALIIIISALFFIVFIILIRSINIQFNSVLSFFSQANILGLCLVYIFSSMKQNSESLDILNPLFLIVIALLLYVACTLFLFIIANKLSPQEMAKYWGGITVYNNILTNLLFSASFLLYRFQHKNPPPESHSVDFTSSKNDR